MFIKLIVVCVAFLIGVLSTVCVHNTFNFTSKQMSAEHKNIESKLELTETRLNCKIDTVHKDVLDIKTDLKKLLNIAERSVNHDIN